MPWKEIRIMDQRLQFLSSYQKEEMSVADLCRAYGTSRPTAYRWINRLKILFWDTTGLWVCAKKLEKGRFHWPTAGDAQGKIVLSHEEFAMLLGGIDLGQAWHRKAAAAETASGRCDGHAI
jgi:predicted DNA-binding transcriptional regulator YafY